MSFLHILLLSTISLSSPLILAAVGGFASERGGIMNIALEGNMLIAAIATALAGAATHNAWIGFFAAICASTALSWLHWLLCQSFKMDQIISGMAINVIAIGAAGFLDKKFTNPEAGSVPVLPASLYYWIAFLLPLSVAVYMRYAKGGLRLLAVGSDPAKARQMGIFAGRVRFVGLTATGVFCGLGGALILTTAGYFTDQMTAGRGFIALAALILGSWRPIPAMVACIVFGMLEGLELQLQGTPILGLHVSRDIWYSLPYLITVIALAGFLGKSKVPAGMGKF